MVQLSALVEGLGRTRAGVDLLIDLGMVAEAWRRIRVEVDVLAKDRMHFLVEEHCKHSAAGVADSEADVAELGVVEPGFAWADSAAMQISEEAGVEPEGIDCHSFLGKVEED